MGQTFKLDLIIDTASDWLVVMGEDCETCSGKVYDISASLEGGQARQTSSGDDEEELLRLYGRAMFKG